ncbi:MAG: T9SS type A sorting domain-containing protein, partial [Tannerella sp.]|nr:T9SS type A sorting domain-containing protein [Tannerella sp.]
TINREVILPKAAEGYRYDRSPGTYHVESRTDFVFVVIANAGYTLANLKVTTDPDFAVSLDRLSTDSTRVTVHTINHNIVLTISGVELRDATANAPLPSTKVWTYNNKLHITSSTAGTAKVYNLTGSLVKIIPYAAGETVSEPLQKGIYIVKTEKGVWKVKN